MANLAIHVLRREQRVPIEPHQAFSFYSDAFALERITPPWLGFRVVTPGPIVMGPGTLIDYRLRLHRVPISWRTRIEAWEPGRRFLDIQVRGPYRLWRHSHDFEPDGRGGTVICDSVRYALPLGPVGALAHAAFVRRDLERIFDYRQAAVTRLLARPREAAGSRLPPSGFAQGSGLPLPSSTSQSPPNSDTL